MEQTGTHKDKHTDITGALSVPVKMQYSLQRLQIYFKRVSNKNSNEDLVF